MDGLDSPSTLDARRSWISSSSTKPRVILTSPAEPADHSSTGRRAPRPRSAAVAPAPSPSTSCARDASRPTAIVPSRPRSAPTRVDGILDARLNALRSAMLDPRAATAAMGARRHRMMGSFTMQSSGSCMSKRGSDSQTELHTVALPSAANDFQLQKRRAGTTPLGGTYSQPTTSRRAPSRSSSSSRAHHRVVVHEENSRPGPNEGRSGGAELLAAVLSQGLPTPALDRQSSARPAYCQTSANGQQDASTHAKPHTAERATADGTGRHQAATAVVDVGACTGAVCTAPPAGLDGAAPTSATIDMFRMPAMATTASNCRRGGGEGTAPIPVARLGAGGAAQLVFAHRHGGCGGVAASPRQRRSPRGRPHSPPTSACQNVAAAPSRGVEAGTSTCSSTAVSRGAYGGAVASPSQSDACTGAPDEAVPHAAIASCYTPRTPRRRFAPATMFPPAEALPSPCSASRTGYSPRTLTPIASKGCCPDRYSIADAHALRRLSRDAGYWKLRSPRVGQARLL